MVEKFYFAEARPVYGYSVVSCRLSSGSNVYQFKIELDFITEPSTASEIARQLNIGGMNI